MVLLRELPQGHEGDHLLVVLEGDEVLDVLAPGGGGRLGQVVDLQGVGVAPVGEDQEGVVGLGEEELLDEILVLGLHAQLALAPALLAPVGGQGGALDVAGLGHGDHHLLVRDHVLHADVAGEGGDLGAAVVAELVGHRLELLPDDAHEELVVVQDGLELGDGLLQLGQLLQDLLPLQPGEALQPHVQDGLGLPVGQAQGGVLLQLGGGGEAALHEALLGLLGDAAARISLMTASR